MDHLSALQLRLSHEREYLAKETGEGARKLRLVWIAQIEREIAAEIAFLGKKAAEDVDMTDDELLADLLS